MTPKALKKKKTCISFVVHSFQIPRKSYGVGLTVLIYRIITVFSNEQVLFGSKKYTAQTCMARQVLGFTIILCGKSDSFSQHFINDLSLF